jgi:NitT/TauT family transport system ATP-binding protein
MALGMDPPPAFRGEPVRGADVPTVDTGGAPLVTVDHVRIGYQVQGRSVLAVADVTFTVSPREKVILLGPSGCGKSTLLKALGGFLQPWGGTITFDGRTRLEPGPDRAVVFQEFDQLFPWRTVADNVAYPLRVIGRDRAAAAAEAARFIDLMGLRQAEAHYPHQLSGGMKQRVAIARALALDPLMLLMDEPFGSLDAQTRARLQRELNEIAERTRVTLLFVTHSIPEAILLGDRVVVLGQPPSRVEEIVDVRGLADPDSRAFVEAQHHLRRLLAREGEPVDHGVVD